MAKNKGPRQNITIECTSCRNNNLKISKGVSRYSTSKNRQNQPEKLSLLKYCKYCTKHSIHKEIK